jgi:hypothetical protein
MPAKRFIAGVIPVKRPCPARYGQFEGVRVTSDEIDHVAIEARDEVSHLASSARHRR